MRKIFITLITCMFFLLDRSYGQLTVTMSSVTIQPNAQASVDVTVSGFTSLLGVQFSMNFDSTALEFANATNFSTALPGLSSAALSGPNGVGVKNGQITFSWFDQAGTGKTLPTGTRLFTLVFNDFGCKISDVITSNVPRVVEIVDANFNEVPLVNVKGVVTCDDGTPVDPCPNPACTDPNSLMISGALKTAKTGDVVCIPFTVKNFTEMQSGQGSFTWNPAQLTYIEFKVPTTGGIPMFDGGINANNVAAGQLGFVWSNPTPGTPVTLPDNTQIIELCFTVLAPTGQTACVLMGQGTIPTEWTDNDGEVPVCFGYGKVTVTDGPPVETVVLTVGNASGPQNTTVCVDVTVDNFTNVLGVGTKFSWDATQLEFVSTSMYDLEGLNSSLFNNNANMLSFLWISQDPITKPDGHKLFQICFKTIGPCDVTAAINVPGPTEVVGEGSVVLPSSTVAGSIMITCGGPTCTLGAITPTTCNGGTDGGAALSVTGMTTNCTCLWKNTATGAIVKPSAAVSAGCNLTGVPAGTYTYEVSCGGTISCSGDAVVTQPNAIVIPSNGAVIVNEGCGQKGSITITPTGGTSPYSYKWTPELGNIPNPTNLNAGQYVVVVTDSKNCASQPTTFTVGNTQPPLTVTATVTNAKCKGEASGAIMLNIGGGCPPASITWSGGLSGVNPQNVAAGIYTVTVTDTAVPSQSTNISVTVIEPAAALDIALTNVVPTSPTSNTGSITLTISGGTSPYKTMWSGGIADGNTTGTITANALAAGSYSVTVTDNNGCTSVRSNIVVGTDDDEPTAPTIGSAVATSIFGDFNVPCNGDALGSLKVTLSAGSYPITAVLKSGTQSLQTQTVNGPDIIFTGLPAGNYTVTVSNTAGQVNSTVVVIKQPTKLSAGTPLVKCTDKGAATGAITIDMKNTGSGTYTYSWLGLSDTDNKVENLAADVYNVTVTDDNGCELIITNIEVDECDSNNGGCYVATTIISPNFDNINDVFVINCAADQPSDLTVFDRWGRVVYSQSNYDNTWMGVHNNGTDLKEGGYIWVLTANFGQGRTEVYKGTVTVLRNL